MRTFLYLVTMCVVSFVKFAGRIARAHTTNLEWFCKAFRRLAGVRMPGRAINVDSPVTREACSVSCLHVTSAIKMQIKTHLIQRAIIQPSSLVHSSRFPTSFLRLLPYLTHRLFF